MVEAVYQPPQISTEGIKKYRGRIPKFLKEI